MTFGIDYSYGSGLTTAQMRAAGVTFACRYLCYLPNGKVINRAEFTNLTGAGIAVVLVWEYTARRMLDGQGAGIADAKEADRQAAALGAAGIPIYFAHDDDATADDQAAINAYLDGAASVVGRARVGLYGGYYPVKRALDAGKAVWAWQTFAWSGGQWDQRAQLQQYQNGVRLGPAEVDYDRSTAADFGQWPRPSAPQPPPPDQAGEETVMLHLPTDAKEIPLTWSGVVARLRFVGLGGDEKFKVDWMAQPGEPHPATSDVTLSYAKADVGVEIPSKATLRAARVVRADLPAGETAWPLVAVEFVR